MVTLWFSNDQSWTAQGYARSEQVKLYLFNSNEKMHLATIQEMWKLIWTKNN